MLIIAQHQIFEPNQFWATAKEITPSLPAHLKLHAVYPSLDLKTSVCLWEASSPEEVQSYLDSNLGDVSKNTCYEINEQAGIGLPQKAAETFSE
jgi:hypothetical protein